MAWVVDVLVFFTTHLPNLYLTATFMFLILKYKNKIKKQGIIN